jgi:hypothetical protein
MISTLPESSGKVIGFLIKGKLTDKDYKQELIPSLEDAIKPGQKIRLLMQMEKFMGWTPHGAWDDFINWPKVMSIERMAFVIDENWHDFMSWLFRVFASIAHIEIRFFRKEQLADAWDWLRAP